MTFGLCWLDTTSLFCKWHIFSIVIHIVHYKKQGDILRNKDLQKETCKYYQTKTNSLLSTNPLNVLLFTYLTVLITHLYLLKQVRTMSSAYRTLFMDVDMRLLIRRHRIAQHVFQLICIRKCICGTGS